jgi:uncharacterized membrane protein (UPF0182 family)
MKRALKYLVLFLIVVVLVGIFGFSDWIIEYWWLDALGYVSVFWGIKLTQLFLLGLGFVVTWIYLGSNAWALAHNLQYARIPHLQFQDRQFSLQDPRILRSIRWILLAVATGISLLFSFYFFSQWDAFFRFAEAPTTDYTDPIFGHNAGFYMFKYPFWELIQNSATTLAFLTTFALTFAYMASGMLGLKQGEGLSFSAPARKHLSLNLAAWLLLLAWGFYLDRYALLFDSSGVVYGPGYTDVHLVIPLLWIMTILIAALAVYAFSLWFIQHTKRVMISGGVLTVVGVIAFVFVPPLYQRFIVAPNELKRETPYLKNNIELSRQGYNLHKAEEHKYSVQNNLDMQDVKDNSGTIDNIRLWDPRLLIQTYRQLQEIRLYYQFYDVDIDRYQTDQGFYQMMLSSRELDADLPKRSNTWVNRHLQYTHGYGLVMSPVAQEGREGMPNLVLRDIPPVDHMGGLSVNKPEIYYGSQQPGYKFANTGVKELNYPKGDQNQYLHYDGEGGIKVKGLLRKLLFAWDRGDINILFSEYINPESRFQIWRNVQERVHRIAPFLKLDKDPYLVLSEGKLYWIQDAYTTSSHFPYSEHY